MKKNKKIVLLGYMASGKSFLGKELARVLNLKFIDLDAYIAKKEELTIAELFSIKGEAFFRKIEFKYLTQLLKSKKSFVLALGGGTPQREGAMELILKKSLSFYLKASPKTLYNRLAPSEVERPLLTKITEDYLLDYITTQLAAREVNYTKANYSIDIDGKNKEEIIQKISDYI